MLPNMQEAFLPEMRGRYSGGVPVLLDKNKTSVRAEVVMAKLTPNRLLSELLTEVGREKTSTVVIEGKTAKVTKVEAVARGLYDLAEGGIRDKVNAKTLEIVQIYVKPDVAAVKAIREFTEGKASPDTVKEISDKKKAGAFGSEIRKRLNEIVNKPKQGPRALMARPTTIGK